MHIFFSQIILDNLKGRANIIGAHYFDMVNFNMQNILYIEQKHLSLENSKCSPNLITAYVAKPCS